MPLWARLRVPPATVAPPGAPAPHTIPLLPPPNSVLSSGDGTPASRPQIGPALLLELRKPHRARWHDPGLWDDRDRMPLGFLHTLLGDVAGGEYDLVGE